MDDKNSDFTLIIETKNSVKKFEIKILQLHPKIVLIFNIAVSNGSHPSILRIVTKVWDFNFIILMTGHKSRVISRSRYKDQ